MHRPSFYAERFQRFMCNTAFKKIPRKCLGTVAPMAAAMVSGFSLLGSHGRGRWMTARALGSLVLCRLFLPPRVVLPHSRDLRGAVSSISWLFRGTALANCSIGYFIPPQHVRKVELLYLCLLVKPSPSKKSRSGPAVPRRSCQGGVPTQAHVSCETRAQVTAEADVEQGWCLG